MVEIDLVKCIKCGKCEKSCVAGAIKPQNGTVNNNRCIGCSHCIAICPEDAVTQNSKSGDYVNDHSISPENFENLIYSRKSIRNYTSKNISNKTLKEFIALMQYAPTGTNSQKTFVTVINNREKITEFSTKMMKFFRFLARTALNPLTYPFMLLIMGKTKTAKLFSYKKVILNTKEGKDLLCYNCPMVVIFHSSPDAATPEMDCNIQSSYASLHAVTLGLGTCFNGFIVKGLNLNPMIKKELGIPKKNRVYSSLLVGYPKLDYRKRAIREDLKVNIIS